MIKWLTNFVFPARQTLTEWIETKWLEEEGKTCVGVKWELFSGVQQVAVSSWFSVQLLTH